MLIPAAAGNAQFLNYSYPKTFQPSKALHVHLQFKPSAIWICFLEEYFILQPEFKKEEKVFEIPLKSGEGELTLLCELLCCFVSICLWQKEFLFPNQVRWFDFVAIGTIFPFLVHSMGLVQESCVLVSNNLLALSCRELSKWNSQENLFPGIINVIKKGFFSVKFNFELL